MMSQVILQPDTFYKLVPDGRRYPSVITYLYDVSGSKRLGVMRGSTITLYIDASSEIAGKIVAINLSNMGSAHAERIYKSGFIRAAYNSKKRRFEIRYSASPHPGKYTLIACS